MISCKAREVSVRSSSWYSLFNRYKEVFEDAIAGHKSPIGSMGSRGKVFVIAWRAGVALISESINIVLTIHSPGSFRHISLPLPTVSDLLFSGGGADDLNVDIVDRPLGLPSADARILSSSFFALASPGHAKISPSSVHRADSSGKGGMSEIEGSTHRRVSFLGGVTGSTYKDAKATSGRAVELVAPVEGGAVGVVVPDSDKGSGDNSSVGQHVPTDGDHRVGVGEDGSRGSSSAPVPPLDINVEFIEPFQELKHLARAFSSFWDGFIESLDDLDDPDDLNYFLDQCDRLEESLKSFGAKLAGLLALQEMDQLAASVREHEHQHHLTLRTKNQLVEEREAEVVIISAAKARMMRIDAKLLACRKVMEEKEASTIKDSLLLREMEGCLASTLSNLKKIEEAEVAPQSLASVLNVLETGMTAGFEWENHLSTENE
ncbi:hypothetical protein ACLOJK_014708 [Asimina triloba]